VVIDQVNILASLMRKSNLFYHESEETQNKYIDELVVLKQAEEKQK
jgi:hypothetical protein